MENIIKHNLNKLMPEGMHLLDVCKSKRSAYFYIAPIEIIEAKEDDFRLLKFRISDHDALCGRSFALAEVLVHYFYKSGYEVKLEALGIDTYDFEGKDLDQEDFEIYKQKIIDYFGEMPNDFNGDFETLLKDCEFDTQDQKWYGKQIAKYFINQI